MYADSVIPSDFIQAGTAVDCGIRRDDDVTFCTGTQVQNSYCVQIRRLLMRLASITVRLPTIIVINTVRLSVSLWIHTDK